MALDINSLVNNTVSNPASLAAPKGAVSDATQGFEAQLQEQLTKANNFAKGYGLNSVLGNEKPSPLNPLSSLANPSILGGDKTTDQSSDQLSSLMQSVGAQASSKMLGFGQEMMAMFQELMQGFQSGELSRWPAEKSYDTVNKLRSYDKGLAKTIKDVELKKDFPHHPQYRQELVEHGKQATQYMSISIAAYSQFSLQGNYSATQGLKEAYDGVGDKVLEKNVELNMSFEMSFTAIFSVNIDQTSTQMDPKKDKIAKIQDDLMTFLKSKDSVVSQQLIDKIYAMMDESKPSEVTTEEETDAVSSLSEVA